jgi:hypothetical protein
MSTTDTDDIRAVLPGQHGPRTAMHACYSAYVAGYTAPAWVDETTAVNADVLRAS